MSEMKSKRDVVESIVQQVIVSSDKDGSTSSTSISVSGISVKSTSATSISATSISATSISATNTSATNGPRVHRAYELYSGSANVSPREITSVRYPMKRCGETTCRNRILSTTHTYSWSRENYDDYFLEIDSKSHDDLLDDVLSCGRQRFDDDDDEAYGTRYDVGPDVVFPSENTTANGHEIELTESPTFHVVDVPNSVTVQGDGDYERIRRTGNVYRDNRKRTRAKTDAVTQTVNAPTDRTDEGCQTTALSAVTAAGTRPDGFDAAGGQGLDARRVSTDDVARTAVFVARAAAQNALMMTTGRREETPPSARVRLDYRFTLTRNDGGPAVISCTNWNGTDSHLLAVAYSDVMYDDRDDDDDQREDVPNAAAPAVAVWNTKNPYAPERFYEFNESAAITCLRFSVEYPSRLAVGFDSGEILIVDIRNERLEIVFRKSKHSAPDIHAIVGLSWTVRLDNGLSDFDQFEYLMTCNSRGGIERYRLWNETFERKTICENDRLAENDELGRPVSATGRSVCHGTRFCRLGDGALLVGTADGAVYTCTYDNLRCYSTMANAHLGAVGSLETSPYAPDVYLTAGRDCTVNIWMADVFVEPVIALDAGGHVEKAVWSRTSPTVVAAVVDNRLVVWDMDETTDAPVAVHEMRPSDRARCTDAEFTSDGSHLCVSDTAGDAVVYAWSDARAACDRQTDGHRGLMRCVARSLRGKTYMAETLSAHRPEYADVFAAIHDEQ